MADRLFRNLQPAGFTLMEILVAVIILGMAYVAVLQNFSVSLKNITKLGASKTRVLENLLNFEGVLRAAAEEPTNAGKGNRQTFYEGRKYQLVTVSNDDDEFMTLLLSKNK